MGVLSLEAKPKHKPVPTLGKELSEFRAYLSRLAILNPPEKLRNETKRAPRLKDYLKVIYGRHMDEVLADVKTYRSQNPDLRFQTKYEKVNLNVRIVRFIADERECGYAFDNTYGQTAVIGINNSKPLHKHYQLMDLHEMTHAAGQLTPKNSFADRSLDAEAQQILQEKDIALGEKAAEKVWRTQYGDVITYSEKKQYTYLLNAMELEARLAALKRLNFALTRKALQSPADTVAALQRLGFGLDEKITQELFEENNWSGAKEALATSPLPEATRKEIFEISLDIADLNNALNGSKDYSDIRDKLMRGDAFKSSITPPLTHAPKLYKYLLKQILQKTPGLAMNRELPSPTQIQNWHFTEPDSPLLA